MVLSNAIGVAMMITVDDDDNDDGPMNNPAHWWKLAPAGPENNLHPD